MNETPSRFAALRDGFAALREIMIVVAILALVLVPTKVRSVLETAGIRSVAGIEFDVQELTDAQNEMALAQQEVEQVMQTLDTAKTNLEQVAANGQSIAPHSNYVTNVLTSAKEATEHASERMTHARGKFRRVANEMTLKSPADLFGDRSANAASPGLTR